MKRKKKPESEEKKGNKLYMEWEEPQTLFIIQGKIHGLKYIAKS